MAGKSSSKRSEKAHRAYRSDYFVTVVEFAPLKEADNAFRAWLATNGLSQDDIDSADLLVDTGRGELGDVRRYRVFRDALPPTV